MKQPRSNTSSRARPRFLEFWLLVANELGTSRLHIDAEAKSIKSFVHRNSDAPQYLHEAIRKSYKLSACQHLSSPICLESVLDILGETAYALQGEQADDLLDIELLEEIVWIISNRYAEQISILLDSGQNSEQAGKATKPQGKLVSFPNYKIRKANANL